ncbi:hypothetical protein QTV49_000279 [Vibrio vulnificus]|nr:hypothetical protein [Vibrio vulnificus]
MDKMDFFSRLFSKKETSAGVAKARLSVIVASSSGADSEIVRELQECVKAAVLNFYQKKNLSQDEIENLNYSLNDETGIMEVQIPLQNK